jgi:hypothetical protein
MMETKILSETPWFEITSRRQTKAKITALLKAEHDHQERLGRVAIRDVLIILDTPHPINCAAGPHAGRDASVTKLRNGCGAPCDTNRKQILRLNLLITLMSHRILYSSFGSDSNLT